MPVRIGREIAQTAQQQRPAADNIPGGMVMQGNGDLNQALQKLALGLGSGPPDILQSFVGFKELGRIKEDKAFTEKAIEIARGSLLHDRSLDGVIREGGKGRREESANIA